MELSVEKQEAACGAVVKNIDLRRPLTDKEAAEIRKHWLEHQVLAFVDQDLTISDIERFALTVGPYGSDPFLESIPGHPHVAQVRREADEKTPVFAEKWHSDWSFLPAPPAATLLYGKIIPPKGGDTLFSNQYAAWEALPSGLKSKLLELRGIHTAGRAYSRGGAYGEKDVGRSMKIRYSDEALKTQSHPIARVHPETGRIALFVSRGYTIGIEGMTHEDAEPILREIFEHQDRLEFVYRHQWRKGTLLLWDNRCVNHSATGGYDGHARLLHRITIAERT